MGRPRLRPDEAATTARVLRAATLEFAARGQDGARLADIAEAAGITRPSLLYHFPSKQALYTAVVHAVFEELGGVLGLEDDVGPPHSRGPDSSGHPAHPPGDGSGLGSRSRASRVGVEPEPFPRRFDAILGRVLAFFGARPEVATLLLRELLATEGPGSTLLLDAGIPVLDEMERFVREAGRGHVRAGLPIRAALLQTFSSMLVRAASGPLAGPLFGEVDHTRTLTAALFFDPPHHPLEPL